MSDKTTYGATKKNVIISLNVPYLIHKAESIYSQVTNEITQCNIKELHGHDMRYSKSAINQYMSELIRTQKILDSYIKTSGTVQPYYVKDKYTRMVNGIEALAECRYVTAV